ncbi:MAG: pyruvate dehydrogenase complex dihydrolipoamide acetyltransferase [Alphaproteobacteria bacterium]|nr:MAG: pyruvate dehydrogenase complex dihydrolipoamide acetyltransferase [Alphaproteobacteria bacterium]TAF38472.1 MAG: pyruvate dehydrogenase complex dihydrolipoamide acetyltransferase [Alphaproteobacteria bacterium]TAF77140.1 MAG: pyruvate dehydrogenase complex dihydrolipoamide acetyltransferase [Alphaproteobacteria bacterium]
MPIEILMPALSPTMTEGTLAKWIKNVGDPIRSGEVIAEIETDKATMEVEAVDEGILGAILIAEGTEAVPVNKLIALILAEGEDKSAVEGYQSASSASAPVVATAAPAASAAPAPAEQPAHATDGQRVAASPLARRIAHQEGVDLTHVQGTGPHGRIIKADVEEAKRATPSATASTPIAMAFAGRNPQEFIEIPNSGMRKTIAKRLTESKQQVPHFYLSLDCELDQLLATRTMLNDQAVAVAGKDGKPAYKLSVNDMVIKAVAMALRDVPAANASWTEAAIRQFNNVDISVAVALEGGLITPIVKNADQKGLAQISNEAKDLIARARAGKLQPSEYQGGGFSISNLGMYGIKSFNAIVNPPQGCILAIGAGEESVVVKRGAFVAVTKMNVTLSCDHRVVDGAVGAEFLGAFKKYIEQPVMMLV